MKSQKKRSRLLTGFILTFLYKKIVSNSIVQNMAYLVKFCYPQPDAPHLISLERATTISIMRWWRNEEKKQLRAFFQWASEIAHSNDIILVDLPLLHGYFCFEFPLHAGDAPKKIWGQRPATTSFIVRKPAKHIPEGNHHWITIFSSPQIEVVENKERFKNGATIPLRWRLAEEEKKLATKIARDALKKFLVAEKPLEKEYFSALSRRFWLKTDLDVALWVGGRLRGSSVLENRTLGKGIAEAAVYASKDPRFKPLNAEELERTRIEITIMHSLHIPLARDEIRNNRIYQEKGYVLQRGEKKGWYLPEVLNVRRFRTLEEFLGDLATEKAGLQRQEYKKADIFLFEVEDFIESEDHAKILTLDGPVVQNCQDPMVDRFNFSLHHMRMAADWLCAIQEQDGNIPPVINALTGKIEKQIDWPRLAFVAWSLVEFSKAVGEIRYHHSAQKSFAYLIKHLLAREGSRQIANDTLTLVYFGELAVALQRLPEARLAATKIIERLPELSFEAITCSQIASFFKIMVFCGHAQLKKPFLDLIEILKENFEKKRKSNEPMSFAVWAELVHTFAGFDQKFSDQLAEWLIRQQYPNGAFPESTISNFVYTRGTAKIFEVLAPRLQENTKVLTPLLSWLFSMQYDRENTFFILEDIRPKIIGGLRHDHFNHEMWIDSAGHLLLGGARLLQASHT